MIRVFSATDTTFTSNGDIVLQPLRAKVTKKDNGDYYLALETGLEYLDFLVEGNIVVANTPTGDQAFRISNVTKTKNKIVSKCWHVFYDSENYLIADSYVEDKTCDEALDHLNSATEPQSPFSVGSDIETINSYRCVRTSLYEAIMTIRARWGGHLVRDNFDIQIKNSIGQDKGIIVQYKKNIKEITCEENWDNVVTELLPVGKDGILLNDQDPTQSIYVSSIVQYAIPYTKTVTFTQDNIVREDYQTEAQYRQALVTDLMAQATNYVAVNCLPQINYTLKANLDRLTDIGDIVEVIDERLGVHLTTSVIGFDYDCILGQYTEVEFGNFSQSLSGLMDTLTTDVQTIASESAQAVQDNIISIMTSSYVVYDGSRMLIVDSLPKETAQNVIKIDSNGIGFSQTGITGQVTSQWNIDGSIELNGSTLSDFVKAVGTDTGWSYRKYKSGQINAFATVTIQNSGITWSTFGSWKKADVHLTCPVAFTSATVTASMNGCTNMGWIAKATYNNGIDLTIIKETTTDDFTVNIMVQGTE